MNIVYQILAKDIRAYTTNIADCDKLCAEIIKGGEIPRVRRMKRTDIPNCDIELVAGL